MRPQEAEVEEEDSPVAAVEEAEASWNPAGEEARRTRAPVVARNLLPVLLLRRRAPPVWPPFPPFYRPIRP